MAGVNDKYYGEIERGESSPTLELVLDFTDLAYLSSAGLRVLLSCQKKMNAAKGSMVVKHVNEIIMEVFEATGFDSILTVEQ